MSEQILEDELINQLKTLNYEFKPIHDEQALLGNLKSQLEKHNNISLTPSEFDKVLNHLNAGSVFDRAHVLRDKMQLTKDDGESVYLEFINQENWAQNSFQVTNQVTVEGSHKNRYDVTLLVNGLPLVQIELKRRGLELKEAFNQINRYQKHSYWAVHGLFNYVQLFVISNGVNTKYYANNAKQTFKQTFYWADADNTKVNKLEDFTDTFLVPSHLNKMISKYIVLNQTDKILMVLRPYQYHAVEAITKRVKENPNKNGYIWHTTGSGKTLTSFKASQILMHMPEVHKVVFVVDRKDLDYQTQKEYNSFSPGSVDGTDNTKVLVDQLLDKYKTKGGVLKQNKLIVTTLQKLNNAVTKRFAKSLEPLNDKRIIFIFDECHRSQFGDTHQEIKGYFNNPQMFGFTGTPIFAENAASFQGNKSTTKDLFDDCLHKYVITDAISDDNVLKFSVEYVGKYQDKTDSKNYVDIDVEDIDTKELLESPVRLDKITDYIIANHGRKTHSKRYTGMFCVSSVDMLIKYYESFKLKDHNLKIATIFSYTANEEDKGATGMYATDMPSAMAADDAAEYLSEDEKHSRDILEQYIQEYNETFGQNFTSKDSQSYYNYYNDIAKKVKSKQIDILLVVNMFLTGFDSKSLNTLYVDKNLRYHGLIQAYSRTNRILDEVKSQGNIICFRNLKKNTDDAIKLYSNKDAIEVIFKKPYEESVTEFDEAVKELRKVANNPDEVHKMISESEKLEFIKAFRKVMRLKNALSTYADFEFEDTFMEEQDFEDYKSMYLDIYEREVKSKEKVSILNDVDFELELIHRDEINVDYILQLLGELTAIKGGPKRVQQENKIKEMMDGQVHMRSKRELIKKFIEEYMPLLTEDSDVHEEFSKFWNIERTHALIQFAEEENLQKDKLQEVLNHYLYTERIPLNDEIVGMLHEPPKLLERKSIIERITQRLQDFVETFISGMGNVG